MRRIILNYWSNKACCSRRGMGGDIRESSRKCLVSNRTHRVRTKFFVDRGKGGWMGGDGSLSRSFREGSRYKVSGKDSGPRTQWFVNFWPMRCVLGRDEETFQIERVILIYLWTVQLAQTTGLSDFQFRNRDLRSRTISRDRLQSPIFLLILLFLFLLSFFSSSFSPSFLTSNAIEIDSRPRGYNLDSKRKIETNYRRH